MDFQLASLWELLVDSGPDHVCLVAGDVRHSRRSLDERANQLGHHLMSVGVEAGDRIGILTYNRAEHVEAMLACWKISAVPINLNFRYVADELEYVWRDADLAGTVVERGFTPVVAEVLDRLDDAGRSRSAGRHVVLEDGTEGAADFDAVEYEAAVAAQPTGRNFGRARSEDDTYIIYTGGTTGMPKGVLWRHGDVFFTAMGGGNYFEPISTPEEIAINATEPPMPMNMLATAPLMHAAGQWVAMISLFSGGKSVIYTGRPFDAADVLDLCAAEGSQTLALVGDAMAIPIAEEMERNPRELPGLFAVSNGGAMRSLATRERLAAAFPGKILSDGFGSSETGTVGAGANSSPSEEGAHFTVGPTTAVIDPTTLEPVPVGEHGMVARTGRIPLGYLNETSSESTFRTAADGSRWVLSGDWAVVQDDGRVLLLGRDSSTINTGGEKVYPEEVEAACITHPDVAAVIVTGVPDERWGARVVALVEPVEGATVELADLQEHCRGKIAGYKVPRDLIVGPIQYTNVGKADTAWARTHAREQLGIEETS